MNTRFLIPTLMLGAAISLAACGNSTIGDLKPEIGVGQVGQPSPAASRAASAQTAGAANSTADQTAGKSGPQAKPAAAGAPGQAAIAPASGFQGSSLPPIPPINRMIIKNGSLSIQVDDPVASLNQVTALLPSMNGVISNQTVRTENDKTFVTMTIQVPPDNFEPTLVKLREMRATRTPLLADTVSSQDVTDQFTDLDAQYRNLSSTRDAYQRLLDKAVSVADIITLTREVANIQTQMDQIKGRQNVLSSKSAVSVITLSLLPVGASPLPNPRPLPKPIHAAQDAWSALLAGLQGFAVVLIWMGIMLPIPTLLLVGGWIIYRRMTRQATYQPEATRN